MPPKEAEATHGLQQPYHSLQEQRQAWTTLGVLAAPQWPSCLLHCSAMHGLPFSSQSVAFLMASVLHRAEFERLPAIVGKPSEHVIATSTPRALHEPQQVLVPPPLSRLQPL